MQVLSRNFIYFLHLVCLLSNPGKGLHNMGKWNTDGVNASELMEAYRITQMRNCQFSPFSMRYFENIIQQMWKTGNSLIQLILTVQS